jgi:HlyD family secretion protein
MMRAIVWILVVGALGAGAWYWWDGQKQDDGEPSYRTAAVVRTDVVSSISANGTVVAEDVVDVGTQVNGQIASFGLDADGNPLDYRSAVIEGQLLAKIDETLYLADVASGEAQLAQAEAQVEVAEANLAQAQAKKLQAERDWARAQKLGESKALSEAVYDATKSAFEQANAGVGVAAASIAQAKASVKSAEASLARSRRNLAFCTIKSPVSGVIIDKRVEVGQTVVSSLNAPSLFLIAKDLSRMEVIVNVNEADIGQVQPGQPVTFTTDAFPGETFRGEVRRVRLIATMTQNVVTYPVEIATGNRGLRLLPFLTANVRFITDRHDDVLAVPNAALRWTPPGAEPAQADRSGRGSASGPASRPERGSGWRGGERSGSRPARGSAPRTGAVWVLDGGKPRGVPVKIGLSDGTLTEVSSEELNEGDDVIVGEQVAGGRPAATTTNPFAPPSPWGGRGRR